MRRAPAGVVSRLKFSVTNQSNFSVASQLLPFQAILLAVCRGVHVVVMRGSVVLHRRYLSARRDWHRCFTDLLGCTTVWTSAPGTPYSSCGLGHGQADRPTGHGLPHRAN
jgi:hypothetical protein